MKHNGTIRTFITFRIAGDDLIPDEITNLLKIVPSHVHRKGEAYSTGRSNIVPATGLWLFSTDRITTNQDFAVHLEVAALLLLGILPSLGNRFSESRLATSFDAVGNILRLKELLVRRHLTATMTFFWHGEVSAEPPAIPEGLTPFLDLIPIHTEIDFDREEKVTPSRRRRAA